LAEAGLIAVLAFLPSRPSRADVESQAEEFAAERERDLTGTARQASVAGDVRDLPLE
jgi:hypothetical protein